MRYQSDLTTPEAVSRQLIKAVPTTIGTPADGQYTEYYDYMLDIIPEVSDYIATECGFSFIPYKETKMMYFRDILQDELWDRNRRLLTLPDNLQNVSSVTWDDVLLSATDYRLHPTDEFAGWGLLFNQDTSLAFNSDFNTGIEIAGTWGFDLNATQGYTTLESVTLVNDTGTSIVVADANAYETLQYVRCESEWMQIIDRDVNTAPTDDTITVIRGVLGTTAAAHSNKSLQTYMPVRGVRHVATRMAAYLYQKRLDVGGVVQIGDAAFLLDQLPVTVKAMINMRKKWVFGHI